ncbi:MAG: hypothetical protein KH304_17705 [Clostridium sp.]|uniref:hypothetical protein n=1 Tax=Clostridia TaxID=186801 RepID=UPI0011DCC046|nr:MULTISPECIES: hypothetical protein [Clostridia]MBS6765397.1 hypothetical protein [Clostridium sp.]
MAYLRDKITTKGCYFMVEKELLNAISDMMDAKFDEFKMNLATKDDIANMATKDDIANMATKDDIANMATKDDIANMATKDDIACIWKVISKLPTKADLREVENNVLTEVDRVQEIGTRHYHEVKREMSQLRAEVRSYQIGSLKLRVDRLERMLEL